MIIIIQIRPSGQLQLGAQTQTLATGPKSAHQRANMLAHKQRHLLPAVIDCRPQEQRTPLEPRSSSGPAGSRFVRPGPVTVICLFAGAREPAPQLVCLLPVWPPKPPPPPHLDAHRRQQVAIGGQTIERIIGAAYLERGHSCGDRSARRGLRAPGHLCERSHLGPILRVSQVRIARASLLFEWRRINRSKLRFLSNDAHFNITISCSCCCCRPDVALVVGSSSLSLQSRSKRVLVGQRREARLHNYT